MSNILKRAEDFGCVNIFIVCMILTGLYFVFSTRFLYPLHIRQTGRYVAKSLHKEGQIYGNNSVESQNENTNINVSNIILESRYDKQSHENVYWIFSNLTDINGKIYHYNQYLSHVVKQITDHGDSNILVTKIKTKKYLYGTSINFLEELSVSNNTYTLYLSWDPPTSGDFLKIDENKWINSDFCVWKSGQSAWYKRKCDNRTTVNINSISKLLPVKLYYQCVLNRQLYNKSLSKLNSDVANHGKICSSQLHGMIKSIPQFNPAYFLYNYSPLLHWDIPHSDVNDAFMFELETGTIARQWNPSCAYCNTNPRFLTYLNIIEGDMCINDRGYIFQNGTRIIVHSCHLSLTLNYLNPLLYSRDIIHYTTPILVLTQNYITNFYHTFIEMAIKALFYVHFLKDNPYVVIHFPSNITWSNTFFQMLQIENEICTGNVTANIVLLPMGNGCSDPPAALLQQAHVFFSKKVPSSSNTPTVVFLHRSEDRKLVQTDEILSKIETLIRLYNLSYHLITYNDTHLPSFKETMVIFHNAKLIIGPHGAGFSNIIFAKPGTFVVDVVCYEPYTRPCFRNMAYKLGMRYYAMLTTEYEQGKRCIEGLYANMTEINTTLEFIFHYLYSIEER